MLINKAHHNSQCTILSLLKGQSKQQYSTYLQSSYFLQLLSVSFGMVHASIPISSFKPAQNMHISIW